MSSEEAGILGSNTFPNLDPEDMDSTGRELTCQARKNPSQGGGVGFPGSPLLIRLTLPGPRCSRPGREGKHCSGGRPRRRVTSGPRPFEDLPSNKGPHFRSNGLCSPERLAPPSPMDHLPIRHFPPKVQFSPKTREVLRALISTLKGSQRLKQRSPAVFSLQVSLHIITKPNFLANLKTRHMR